MLGGAHPGVAVAAEVGAQVVHGDEENVPPRLGLLFG